MTSDTTTRLSEPLTAGVLLQVLDGVRGDYLGMAGYHEDRAHETDTEEYQARHEQQGREARLMANLVGEIAQGLREALGIDTDE